MEYFKNITSFNEGRLIYRRLARLNHPDLGGNPEVMKKINIEFEKFKANLENANSKFHSIQPGDFVIVNKSVSIVLEVTRNTFTAKSNHTDRIALFSKDNGVCISNSKFKAELIKQTIDAK